MFPATMTQTLIMTVNVMIIFKLFPGKGFALSKYSPVTLHSSPATAILNETPDYMYMYADLFSPG